MMHLYKSAQIWHRGSSYQLVQFILMLLTFWTALIGMVLELLW